MNEETKSYDTREYPKAVCFMWGANGNRYGETLEMCPFPPGSETEKMWKAGWFYEADQRKRFAEERLRREAERRLQEYNRLSRRLGRFVRMIVGTAPPE